jgi:D-3-phosphoglycerate dehydrogenase
MAILIIEPKNYSPKAVAIYKSLGPVYLGLPDADAFLKPEAKPRRDIKILVARLAYFIGKNWMDKLPNLKVIVLPGTGLVMNFIDLPEARKRGIKVITLKGHTSFMKNIPSTAEGCLALMMALVRNIPWSFDDVKKGHWNRDIWRGHQVIHKTLGLLGCGRLGKIMAKYGKALGMNILGSDPYIPAKTLRRYGIQPVSLERIFKESDIVSLHPTLTPETYNLVKEKHFKMMKPTAYLINSSCGEIVNEAALLKALKNKWIAGAALDVLWDERGDGSHLRGNPLVEYARKNNNLIIVPHLGGATYEAMQITEDFVADLVKKFFKR